MNSNHIATWLWCQISIAKMYLDMLDYTDPVVIEHQESEGWTKQNIINMLEEIAVKANEIAAQVTRIDAFPTENTAYCICRMMNLGIKLNRIISDSISR